MKISRYRKPELNIVGFANFQEREDFSMYHKLDEYLFETFVDGEFTFDTENEIKHSKLLLFDRGTWYFIDTNKKIIKLTRNDLEPTHFNKYIINRTIFNHLERCDDFIEEIPINDSAKENIDVWGNDFLNNGGSFQQELAEKNKNLEYIR